MTAETPPETPHVALFVTCLVDLFRPSVGFAATTLLEGAGCRVSVPKAQTCCGQPAYNSGSRADARRIAWRTVKALESYDYVVVPSASCAGMIRKHYPALFIKDRPERRQRVQAVADRTWELLSFLTDVMNRHAVIARLERSCTYHDGCSGLRELGIREQPRHLLRSIFGLKLVELPESEVCCGFGGTFCVKYPEISNRMVEDKASNVEKTGADMLLAGDLGCLLNIAGKLKRRGSTIEVRHVAEVLAAMTGSVPPIGEVRLRRAEVAPANTTMPDD